MNNNTVSTSLRQVSFRPSSLCRGRSFLLSRPGRQWRPVGLSIPHISRKPSRSASAPVLRLEIAKDGSLARLRGSAGETGRTGGGKRGRASFSAASRKRLLELVASVSRTKMRIKPLFVTLTYPDSWSPSSDSWKKDLDNFCRRLLYHFPKISILWRLEFQDRGAPHYHLVIFGIRFIPYYLVADWWNTIVAPGNREHYNSSTSVEQSRSWNQTGAYVSKYVAKIDDSYNVNPLSGRLWGVYGRANLPIDIINIELLTDQFLEIRDLIRTDLLMRGVNVPIWYQYGGITCFLPYDDLLALIGPLM